MIKDIIEKTVVAISDILGDDIKVVICPSIAGDVNKYAETPTLVFEGPTLKPAGMDFEIEYDDLRTENEGEENEIKIRGAKKWFVHVDIVFNMRFFFTSLYNEIDLIEKINCLRGSINSIMHEGKEYAVCIDEEFSNNITPNFSDIKHYESACIIENVRIRKGGHDEEVKELKEIYIVKGEIT